ncbi:hypothetical protein RIF29_32564 [Crotalaria pallida]|uniref:Uncharacterized protein n=1 Tax=Crotalaria pallida TaxID=3830 RepID=A0AAN9HXS1_CROPI
MYPLLHFSVICHLIEALEYTMLLPTNKTISLRKRKFVLKEGIFYFINYIIENTNFSIFFEFIPAEKITPNIWPLFLETTHKHGLGVGILVDVI